MVDSLRLELRVSRELLDRLDEARGQVPRGTFIKDRLDEVLPARLNGSQLPGESRSSLLAEQVPGSPPLMRASDLVSVEGGSCPECSGDLRPVEGRLVCADCGWRR